MDTVGQSHLGLMSRPATLTMDHLCMTIDTFQHMGVHCTVYEMLYMFMIDFA